jgi:hypothetical protein
MSKINRMLIRGGLIVWCLCMLARLGVAQSSIAPMQHGIDTELKEFRLDDLRTDLGGMKDGRRRTTSRACSPIDSTMSRSRSCF